MSRKRGANGELNNDKLHVSVTPTTTQQIRELADAMQIPRAAVVRQAIARWHRDEFERRPKNGASKIIEEFADGVARTFKET